MSLLSLKNVTLGYPIKKGWKDLFSAPSRSTVVENLSFEIQEGEILGLIGESGCGKTTLMRGILGQLPLTEGKILWKGESIETIDLKKRAKDIQFIFQNPFSAMNPKLNVFEIISEPLCLLSPRPLTQAQRIKRVEEIMHCVGLPKRFLFAYPHQFSGGEAQRVAIARALIVGPKLLICDEPVSALDVSIQAKIINLLLDLNRRLNISIIFISHNLIVVRQLAHKILVLYRGAEMEYGAMEELLYHAQHPYTSALWSVVALPTIEETPHTSPCLMKEEAELTIERPVGCLFNQRCPFATKKCWEMRPKPIRITSEHRCRCFYAQMLDDQLWRPNF